MGSNWRDLKVQGRIGIAAAENELVVEVLEALPNTIEMVYLFGNEAMISTLVGNAVCAYTIVHCETNEEASLKACQYAKAGTIDCVMKGAVDTSVFLKAVLKELKTERRLTHVALFEDTHYHKPFIVSDVAMNIAPDVQTFESIIANACEVANAIGVPQPKVALLAAKEKVEEKMPITKTYQAVKQACATINARISGPLSLDVALRKEAAAIKGLHDDVCGDADILIMPDIEAGNIFYKTMTTFTDASVASLIMGATTPLVLTSRADGLQTRMDSIMLAMLLGGKKNENISH